MASQQSESGVLFELWRQDDNGNRFLIGVFTRRAAAERRMAGLCRNPHKQIYWISEKHGDPPAPVPPDDATPS